MEIYYVHNHQVSNIELEYCEKLAVQRLNNDLLNDGYSSFDIENNFDDVIKKFRNQFLTYNQYNPTLYINALYNELKKYEWEIIDRLENYEKNNDNENYTYDQTSIERGIDNDDEYYRDDYYDER